MEAQRFVLTLSCPDRMGIVAAVANFLLEHRCNILDSAQFGDPDSRRFFMRVCFAPPEKADVADIAAAFETVAARLDMRWRMNDMSVRQRVLLMVSGIGHCLNDLLYRHRIGALHIEIPAIVSNHRVFEDLAASHGIPFHFLPVERASPPAQEDALLRIMRDARIDLVVLARYMQILSPAVCAAHAGRIINIHHSFLPSFRGSRPYQQAHDRGVKLIGATAHYVTAELDEGPIIEQDVIRVDHSHSVEQFAAAGRDVECIVLARAVAWHIEHRILLSAGRTVVFR